jgi:GNAT superfamily N-acetyltransferase
VASDDADTIDAVVLRPAVAEDVDSLSELAVRAKAHWGYDDDFIEACREELRVRPGDIDTHRFTAAVDVTSGRIVGFYGLTGTSNDDAELSELFVEPDVMGTGVGRRMFDDAVRVAEAAGFTRLRIEADPFASSFYEHMGAARTGTAPSGSIPGRELPVYTLVIGP